MQLVSLKAALATAWVPAALIPGIAGNLDSVTSWTVLAGVGVIPTIVMMWRWNARRQTMSESIQEMPMTEEAAILADTEADIRGRNLAGARG